MYMNATTTADDDDYRGNFNGLSIERSTLRDLQWNEFVRHLSDLVVEL